MLCLVARFRQAVIAHALGIPSTQPAALDDVLLAAKHVWFKARRNTATLDRLIHTLLPALAVLKDTQQIDTGQVQTFDSVSGARRSEEAPLFVLPRSSARQVAPEQAISFSRSED